MSLWQYLDYVEPVLPTPRTALPTFVETEQPQPVRRAGLPTALLVAASFFVPAPAPAAQDFSAAWGTTQPTPIVREFVPESRTDAPVFTPAPAPASHIAWYEPLALPPVGRASLPSSDIGAGFVFAPAAAAVTWGWQDPLSLPPVIESRIHLNPAVSMHPLPIPRVVTVSWVLHDVAVPTALFQPRAKFVHFVGGVFQPPATITPGTSGLPAGQDLYQFSPDLVRIREKAGPESEEAIQVLWDLVRRLHPLFPSTVINTGTGGGPRTFGITIDGDGATITTGVKGYVRMPVSGTITKATLLAAQSGSIVIDVWKDSFGNYPPTNADSITASAPPTLSSADKMEDSTLTGWTKVFNAGEVFGFNVDSATTIQWAILIIEFEPS